MDDKSSLPRIGVFTKALDNWKSGSGHHMDEMMRSVLDQNEGRFDFTFIHYAKSENPVYERARELIIPRNPITASTILRREGFDVLHYAPLTIYAPLWNVRAKKMATMHGAEQLLIPQFFGQVELAHERLVVPNYARRMDRILTVSETSKKYFVDNFRVPAERIVVAYNGLGPAYRVLPPSEVTAPERFGVKGAFIFHVSRFSERKNPWTLLNAYASLVESGSVKQNLVCAGGGWDGEQVKKRAVELGIADRLITPGFVAENDLVQFLNAADLFVFPSLAEGFGMPNVEAMACGCPVVTSAAFAVPEIVGDAAVVVGDPMDSSALAGAMARVLTNPDLAAGLRAKGLERVKRYSWKESAEKLIGVYADLCAEKGKRV
jgi:glycosyltransferase involved in cell wall biosynthesis